MLILEPWRLPVLPYVVYRDGLGEQRREGDGVAHTAAGSAIVSVLERCACISDRSPCLQSHRLRARLQSSAAC